MVRRTPNPRSLALALALTAAVSSAFAQDGAKSDSGSRVRGDSSPQAVQQRVVPPSGAGTWYFGANGESTDTGVRLRSVDRGSPAALAGLEAGDTVVTVAGYQVGRVGGRTFGLDEELHRQVDANGRVRLLVLDRRTGNLTNLDATLHKGRPEERHVVRGRAMLPPGDRLPRAGEIRIKLVRRAFFGKKTEAEVTRPIAGSPPIAFELKYDANKLDFDAEYELEVEIFENNQRLFYQNGTYRVRLDRPAARYDVNLRRP